MKPSNTKVTIFNQTFEISSSSLNIQHLQELAQFVDEQMRKTFHTTKLSSALKVAVLTSLNLAEELLSLKNSNTYHKTSPPHKEDDIAELSTMILNFKRRIDSLNHQIQLIEHSENES